MNTKEIVRTLTGSVVVYAIVASCSPSSASNGPSSELGTGGGAGANRSHAGDSAANGGATTAMRDASASSGRHPQNGNGGKSVLDAALDRMTHPVPDAHADPSPSGSRLRAKYYVGDDGSKQFIGWHDSMRNEDCSFMMASDGVMRCLPLGAGVVPIATSNFADSGCSKPLALVTKATCKTVPKYAESLSLDGCNQYRFGVYVVGAHVDAVSSFTGSPSACTVLSNVTATSLETIDDLYATSEVDPKSFVAATTMTE